MRASLLPVGMALAFLGAGIAAALDAPALVDASLGAPFRAGSDAASPGTAGAGDGEPAQETSLTVPLDHVGAATGAATSFADAQAARAVILASLMGRNASAAATKALGQSVPDAEVVHLANAVAGYLTRTEADVVAFASLEGALLAAVAAEKTAEADAVARAASLAVGTAGAGVAALADEAAADVPQAVGASAAELLRLLDALRPDPDPVVVPVQDAATALPPVVEAQVLRLAVRLCAAPGAMGTAGTLCAPGSLGADLLATAQTEAAMQGVLAAESQAAAGFAADAETTAETYREALGAAVADAVVATAEGVQQPTPSVPVPFDPLEDALRASAGAVIAGSEALRSNGGEGVAASSPLAARARSGLGTAVNGSLAALAASEQLGLASRALLAEACTDPLSARLEPCHSGSLVRRGEAVLQAPQDVVRLDLGDSRARTTSALDAQGAATIAAGNEAARSVVAAIDRMQAQAGQNALAVPLGEASRALAAALAYEEATQERAAALPPALAAEVTAEPGAVMTGSASLAAQASAAAVAPLGVAAEGAAGVVTALTR